MHTFYVFVALAFVAAVMAAKLDVATDDQFASRESIEPKADIGQEINNIFAGKMNEDMFSRGKRHIVFPFPIGPVPLSWPYNQPYNRRCQYWNGRYICY